MELVRQTGQRELEAFLIRGTARFEAQGCLRFRGLVDALQDCGSKWSTVRVLTLTCTLVRYCYIVAALNPGVLNAILL